MNVVRSYKKLTSFLQESSNILERSFEKLISFLRVLTINFKFLIGSDKIPKRFLQETYKFFIGSYKILIKTPIRTM